MQQMVCVCVRERGDLQVAGRGRESGTNQG